MKRANSMLKEALLAVFQRRLRKASLRSRNQAHKSVHDLAGPSMARSSRRVETVFQRPVTVSVLTLSLAALSHPAGSLAQEVTLEEIIVTAQKREQRLIEVPVSITALSGQELEQRGLSSIQDISFAVPGMAMREDGPGSYTIFMRGLSNQYGSDALVGVYLDEAPLSLTGFDQLDSRALDLERVEVLKGPQGTLYGQGSVAGAIRYITKAPQLDEFGGSIEAQESFITDGDSHEVITGVLNAPIVKDVFGIRIAATLEEGGGWQ